MNTDTKISSITHYTFLITLLSFLCVPLSHADDYGMGQMGMGQMGMGQMGMGQMGMGQMGMGRMGMGQMGMGRIGMLDLSSAQRKQFREIKKSMRPKRWAIKDQMAEHSDQLSELYSKDKPNAKAISAVYKKIFDLKRQKIELHINTKNQIYDILTKEQREKQKAWKSGSRGNNPGFGRGMHRMMQE